jgi:hypothetical protein
MCLFLLFAALADDAWFSPIFSRNFFPQQQQHFPISLDV